MIITVAREPSQLEHTYSKIFIDGRYECEGLEDQHQDQKVAGHTRIPSGIYPIRYRVVGGFHNRYSKKPWTHYGMLEIFGVPNFKYVLIHIGNTDDDTAGCLLVGKRRGTFEGKAAVLDSTKAYIELYEKVSTAYNSGEDVFIQFIDLPKFQLV